MKQIRLYSLILVLLMVSCSKVPLTGRRQLNFIPVSMLGEMSLTNYQAFLTDNPPLPANNANTVLVKNAGNRISQAVENYLNENRLAEKAGKFSWEFNLVQNEAINAWCMPGGKVVFYTGILPYVKDESGIAVVMGHEIAHAVANHGGERMSQQLALMLGGVTLNVALQQQPALTRDIFNSVYGVGSVLGPLAYSRKHEYEADKLGLIFMAKAGYDPARAITFWEEMAAIPGQAPPEFLSTHPSNQKRIKALRDFIPEANNYYQKP
ncbi:MAG: M48 family metallopeptidase [Lentimicrobium sp.]|nr:M48 family metallopeptidase [Lentimicrobium sp.]